MTTHTTQRRETKITLRLTPQEHEFFSQKAVEQQRSLANYFVRSATELDRCYPGIDVALAKVSAELTRTRQELAAIGRNLNQLAKATNIALQQGQPIPGVPPEELDILMEKLEQLNQKVIRLNGNR